MNRKEIINRLSVEADATKHDSGIFLDSLIKVLSDALSEGEKVSLRGFGTFEINQRKVCVTKHPRTGEECIIPEHKICKFTQSDLLRDKINMD